MDSKAPSDSTVWQELLGSTNCSQSVWNVPKPHLLSEIFDVVWTTSLGSRHMLAVKHCPAHRDGWLGSQCYKGTEFEKKKKKSHLPIFKNRHILNKNLYFWILLEKYKIWQHWALMAIIGWIWVMAAPLEGNVASPGAHNLHHFPLSLGHWGWVFLTSSLLHSCCLPGPCKQFLI